MLIEQKLAKHLKLCYLSAEIGMAQLSLPGPMLVFKIA